MKVSEACGLAANNLEQKTRDTQRISRDEPSSERERKHKKPRNEQTGKPCPVSSDRVQTIFRTPAGTLSPIQ
jgi:hypothetical protein